MQTTEKCKDTTNTSHSPAKGKKAKRTNDMIMTNKHLTLSGQGKKSKLTKQRQTNTSHSPSQGKKSLNYKTMVKTNTSHSPAFKGTFNGKQTTFFLNNWHPGRWPHELSRPREKKANYKIKDKQTPHTLRPRETKSKTVQCPFKD